MISSVSKSVSDIVEKMRAVMKIQQLEEQNKALKEQVEAQDVKIEALKKQVKAQGEKISSMMNMDTVFQSVSAYYSYYSVCNFLSYYNKPWLIYILALPHQTIHYNLKCC